MQIEDNTTALDETITPDQETAEKKVGLGLAFIEQVKQGHMEPDCARELFQTMVDSGNITSDQFVELNRQLTAQIEGSPEDKKRITQARASQFAKLVQEGKMELGHFADCLALMVQSTHLTKQEAGQYLQQAPQST